MPLEEPVGRGADGSWLTQTRVEVVLDPFAPRAEVDVQQPSRIDAATVTLPSRTRPIAMSRPEGDDGDTVLERAPRTARAQRWCVVFYNDDYTTKWFVVHVLEQFFRMSETSATAFMLAVHEKGKGVAGVYTRDIAETKATQVNDYAREFGMPLKVEAEPDDDDNDPPK
jgi:ATP-dependent Clp protease adaptor protein ClpS